MTIVPPEGPKDAKIVILGEAPGKTEELMGRPFIGASGELLNEMLSKAGIHRHECYVTNVCKFRPEGNKFASLYEKNKPKPALAEQLRLLEEELSCLSPNIIICLGNEALKAVTGKKGIGNWRGSILNTKYGKALPTYHPAAILRQYSWKAIGVLDLKKAKKESEFKDYREHKTNFLLSPSFEEVKATLAYLKKEKPPVAFDIETLFGEPIVRCLGLAWSPHDAICIPFLKRISASDTISLDEPVDEYRFTNYWESESEEYELLSLLSDFFFDASIPKIAQNYPFDSTYLAHEFGFHIRGLWMDTLAVHHCCYSELPKALDFLCSLYTPISYYSDYSPSNDESTWRYNSFDVIGTWMVAKELKQIAEDMGVWDFYKSHCEPCMYALTRAQNRGVRIDTLKLDRIKTQTDNDLYGCKRELQQLTGKDLTSDTEKEGLSSKKVMAYLYDELRLKPVINRQTKKRSASEQAIRVLKLRYPKHSKLFELLVKYRELTVLRGNFLKAKLTPNNRMLTTYSIYGTVTGRLSSSKNLFGYGLNMQQIPSGSFRDIFITDPGYVLIKVDLSQAEARYVAWESRAYSLIERFLDPSFDIHRWAASMIFQCKEEEVTKEQRQTAKIGVHGGNYGLQPKSAALQLNVPLTTATLAIEGYSNAVPEIGKWRRDLGDRIRRTRKLSTPFGRQRIFLDRITDETLRSAFAFLPQSTIADIINRAFGLAEAVLSEFQVFPLITVHDEIVFLAPECGLEESTRAIQRLVEFPIEFPGVKHPLIIPAEIKVGPSWYAQEPLGEYLEGREYIKSVMTGTNR